MVDWGALNDQAEREQIAAGAVLWLCQMFGRPDMVASAEGAAMRAAALALAEQCQEPTVYNGSVMRR